MRSVRNALPSRRLVLRSGAIALGLPLLDATTRRARAAEAAEAAAAVFVVGCNGVAQASGTDPERFWPKTAGPLTRASMMEEADLKATALLAEHAERTLILRGIRYPYPSPSACAHTWGDNQCLTARRPTGDTEGPATSLATGVSVDDRMARGRHSDKRGPLTLHAGGNIAGGRGYGNPGFVSYRASGQPNAPESSPWVAYQRMIGLPGDGPAQQEIVGRRKSVNDVLRGQLQRLLGRRDLSAADRRRLDVHLSSIRDIELKMGTALAPEIMAEMKRLDGTDANGRALYRANDERAKAARLHMDLLAIGLAGGHTKVATLKIGDNNDGTKYVLGGVQQPSFHWISHRNLSDGGSGAKIENAFDLHSQIDRIMMGHFKYLCDALAARETPSGLLLDTMFVAWTNQIATGGHGYKRLPWVIVGRANGALRTGQFLDVKEVNNNVLYNTLLAAAGVRNDDGTPILDFGAPELVGGVIPGVLR